VQAARFSETSAPSTNLGNFVSQHLIYVPQSDDDIHGKVLIKQELKADLPAAETTMQLFKYTPLLFYISLDSSRPRGTFFETRNFHFSHNRRTRNCQSLNFFVQR
jgi:hypothetical protein